MGAVAHSSFTARGIAERQRVMAVDPELIERRREYEERTRREADERQRRADAEEIARLKERNRFLEERERHRVAAAASQSTRSPRMGDIAERICRATGFRMVEIRSERKSAELVFVRQAIAYWIIRQTGHSYPAVGKFLGGRDHQTMRYSARIYQEKRAAMGRHLRPLDTGKRGN